MLTAASVVALHFALVAWQAGPYPSGERLIEHGALVAGATLREPWRLLTSLFLHSDARHAFWNGVSLLVFAVPLLTDLGTLRTGLIYLSAGIGGGAVAVGFARPGTTIIGSSGAVAGLFGAWVVLNLRAARYSALSWRARVRTLGVALLVLPSLLNPRTPEGQPISVSSHLGGMATGMLIGAVLSARLVRRELALAEADDDEAAGDGGNGEIWKDKRDWE